MSGTATVQEGNFLSGIAAMNDMIAMFPRDKHVYYVAANWLMGVQGNEQAHQSAAQALDIDPDFAPALNNLAYLHARNREFNRGSAIYGSLCGALAQGAESAGFLW